MAGRTTRSSARLGVTSPCVGKPFKVSKRKNVKIFTEHEKKEIAKYEIKAGQFHYRLRSVKDILKNLDNDKSSEGGSGRKGRRKSKIFAKRRRSIAEAVMLRNFQKETSSNKDEDIENVELSQEHIEERKEPHVAELQSESQSPLEEKAGASIETEEAGEVSTSSELNQSREEAGLVEDNGRKETSSPGSEVVRTKTGSDIQMEEAGIRSFKVRSKAKSSNETEEEAAERLRIEINQRKETLEKIKKLKKEHEEWITLYESCQQRLLQVKSEEEALPELVHSHFSDEQKQFLEAKVDPKELMDRLKQYQTDHVAYARYVQDFTERMSEFKKTVSEHLMSLPSIVSPAKEGYSRTPRSLIANFLARAKDVSSQSDQSF